MPYRTPINRVVLLSGVTTTTTGTGVDAAVYDNDDRNFVASVSGAGSVAATVLVEVSNNNSDWIELGTITLSGTTSDSDGFIADEGWQYVRGRVSAISGTGAAVTLTMAA